MYTRILPALAGALLVATSCYKDMGNYEYTTEPNAIKISKEMNTNPNNPTAEAFVFKLGQPIDIEAKYTIVDKSLNESDIQFEWYFGQDIVSTTNKLHLDAQPAGRYVGMLVLTDTRFNQKYMAQYNFQVDEAYSDGWAVLTDNGSESQLHYIQIDANDNSYIVQKDVYGTANNGAKLASGVTDMASHMYNTYPQVFALSIVQPGQEGAIELNIHDMSVLGCINKEFNQQDESREFVKVSYLDQGVYAFTATGDLYVRQDVNVGGNTVPHSGIFPSSPVIIEDGVKIEDWVDMAKISNFVSGINTLVAYDSANSRLVRINGTKVIPFSPDFYLNDPEPHRRGKGFDGTNYYDDITFPEPYDLSKYNVLEMAGCGADASSFDPAVLSVVLLLQDKQTKENYIYAFRFMDAWGMIDVDLDLFFPVPDDLEIDPENILINDNVGGPDNLLYFTGKDKKSLWYMNLISGIYNKVYTASSEITGYGYGEISNLYGAMGMGYTPYFEQMIVGTEDGKATILKMDAAARASGKPEVLHTAELGAPVKKVAYLPNQSISY